MQQYHKMRDRVITIFSSFDFDVFSEKKWTLTEYKKSKAKFCFPAQFNIELQSVFYKHS